VGSGPVKKIFRATQQGRTGYKYLCNVKDSVVEWLGVGL
jgi:hypothetical protein